MASALRLGLAIAALLIAGELLGQPCGHVNFRQPALTALPPGYQAGSVTVGHFHSGGFLDVAVSATGRTGGDGVFIIRDLAWNRHGTPTLVGVGPLPNALGVADFNHDGNLDLAVTTFAFSVAILLGKGDGAFAPPHTVPVGLYPAQLAIADFDEDGNDDIAVTDAFSPTPWLVLGDGQGSFAQAQPIPGVGRAWIAAGDFNGDGHKDLVVLGGSELYVLVGDGRGSFVARTFAVPQYTTVAVDDINRDGRDDLVFAGENYGPPQPQGSVFTMLGMTDGSLGARSADTLVTGGANWVATGDFNGDLVPDVAVSNPQTNGVSILLGSGNGSFRTPVSFDAGISGMRMTVGDLNGDGRPDIVLSGGTGVSALINGCPPTAVPALSSVGLLALLVALGIASILKTRQS